MNVDKQNCENFSGCLRIFSELGCSLEFLYVFLSLFNYLFSCNIYYQYVKYQRQLQDTLDNRNNFCQNCAQDQQQQQPVEAISNNKNGNDNINDASDNNHDVT